MRIIEPLIAEFKHEAGTTRKCLENVPEEKWDWAPHERSMPLGRLASHIQEIPEWLPAIVDQDEFAMPGGYEPYTAESKQDMLDKFDLLTGRAAAKLNELSDERALATWRMTSDGQVLMEVPRIAAIRAILLSHMIHHRGQLSVYLRLTGGKVPSIYGPSADDNPYA